MDRLSQNIIYGGTKESVERLIQQGEDVNEVDKYGYTPLTETAIMSNGASVDIATVLLQHGAEVDKTDMTGRTALYWAVENSNLPLAKLLLDHNADPNAYTLGSEPILVNPLLRGQYQLKNLLYKKGANLEFAQDYINAKLLGHRFELPGKEDIVNAKGIFIEMNFEGFFLEFTLLIACDSLKRYIKNFAARHMRSYVKSIKRVIAAFECASALLRYQDITIDLESHQQDIDKLLNQKLLLLPLAYRGHAITLAKYGNFLAKCDRGENSQREGTLVIYEIHKEEAWSNFLIKELLYKKHTTEFIHHDLNIILGLETVTQLPLPAQLIGNCSWANVEGAIPAMLFLLFMEEGKEHAVYYKGVALSFYEQWREWDKARALDDCFQSFDRASPARKATKAGILGRILFQKCQKGIPKDLDTVQKILSILTLPGYDYVLKSYINIYCKHNLTEAGKNLLKVLEYCDVVVS